MDIREYGKQKANGKASMIRHAGNTVLVSIAGVDRGYQRKDIELALQRFSDDSVKEGVTEESANAYNVVNADLAAL